METATPAVSGAIRVLIVVGDFPVLSETFVLDQITGLIDRGFSVDILAARLRSETVVHADVAAYRLLERTHCADWSAGGGRGLFRAVKIVLAQIARGRFGLVMELLRAGMGRKLGNGVAVEPRQLLAYARTIERLPAPEVVLCHFGPHGDLMVRLRNAMRARWPVATFFHGYDVSTLLKQMGPRVYDRLFREGELFFPISEFFRLRLLSLGAAGARTEVLRMGVRPLPAPELPERRSRADLRAFAFLSIGRLTEKKGHEYTIRAIACCRERNPEMPVSLTIIGDGPLGDRLFAVIRELRLEEFVVLRGGLPREEVRKALFAADGFVLASVTAEDGDMEGIPVVISEAMSFGLPVITTIHGGIPELIEDGVTGLLVGERDSDTLAEAMLRIVINGDLADRVGQAGRRKLEAELDLDRWNDLLADRVRALAS